MIQSAKLTLSAHQQHSYLFSYEHEQKVFPVSLIKYGCVLEGKHLLKNIDILGTGISIAIIF